MKILYAILNMGLGHATRSLELIRELLRRGHEIHLISTGRSLQFLRKELTPLPSLHFMDIPDYNFHYDSKIPAYLSVLMQSPSFLRTLEQEKKIAAKLIDQYHFDGIISDHRYGFYSEKIPSIFITHQLVLQPPFNAKILRHLSYSFHARFLKNFKLIIVPDFEGPENLSGKLSHDLPGQKYKVYYAGPLLSLHPGKSNSDKQKTDILVMISGPEPQRTMLEKKVLALMEQLPYQITIVLGTPEQHNHTNRKNIAIYSHLPRKELQEKMQEAQLIICRSGYTTLMEIAAFQKPSILIPTPGQTEQLYLAHYWQEKNWAYSLQQNQLDRKLVTLIHEALQKPLTPKINFEPQKIIVNLADTIEEFIRNK